MISDTQWVINKKFDSIFFLGSALMGVFYFILLFLLPRYAFLITAVVWVVFAQAHFGSTWFIYFDKRNRVYYYQHWVRYYFLPLAIFATVLVVGYYKPVLIAVLISAASLYHVSKQSIGILQIYRVRNKEFSPFEKKLETSTIFGWTLFFGGFGALRLPDFRQFLIPVLPLAEWGVWLLLFGSLVGTGLIIYFALKRPQNSWPKNIFLVISLFLYAPYLYAAVILVDAYQMEIATLTSLVAHYMQYMGLVWLINKNKYTAQTEFGQQNVFLAIVSQNYGYILAVIFGYALLMALFRWGVPTGQPLLIRIVPNIVLGLTAVHFYIDSFIWRFRNPFYKETVLPFIKPVQPIQPTV